MPETRGLPEPEPTTQERVTNILTQAIAGQGIVRRIVLYVVAGSAAILSAAFGGGIGLLFAVITVVALLLLALTDKGVE